MPVTNASPAVLPGTVAWWPNATAPAGWLKCNGAAVSRTAYAALFATIGLAYGAGDGSTTFNIPDLRGEFIRGLDDGRGVDAGRAICSSQADTMQGHKHANAMGGGAGGSIYPGYAFFSGGPFEGMVLNPVSDGANGAPRVGAETRPRNVAFLACMKY